MTRTQTIVLTTVSAVLIVAAIAVKMVFFPAISDKYFVANSNRLKTVPPGLIVVRPTHFKNAPHAAALGRIVYANAQGNTRIVGVDITFQRLISLAYNQNPGRITLPSDAPTNINYDVLFTGTGDMSFQLQTALRHKLGYVADMESNEVPVLALKVEGSSLQSFKISPATEKPNTDMRNGTLYFTHLRVADLTDGIGSIAGSPVVDETGLTSYYDFSLIMTPQVRRMLQNGSSPDKDTLLKILAGWGLGLEPDTATMGMLVVKKT
jgi:uncharacterized protein (TIGR03435 family)